MKIKDQIWVNKDKILIYSILSIILILIVGVILFPHIFYDNFIWKYYWGPVVADSIGTPTYHPQLPDPQAVKAVEGYTVVSEITYGIILIIALYFIYKLLKKLDIKVNWRFALALMPYILYGPLSRVLEDSDFFTPPAVYWFISPLIYLQIAIFAIFFLLLGYYIEKKFPKSIITVNKTLFLGGLIFLIPSIYLIIRWIIGDQWSISFGVRFDVFLIVLGFVFLITGLVYLIGYIKRNNEKFAVYKNPLNLFMLVGHLIDGITSYISIKDPFMLGLAIYTEKHPGSNFLLEIWGPLFPIVKFILIIVVIYVFDVLYKEELIKYSTFINLLKIGILILGFSPGVRDLLRVTMGV